MATDGCQKPFGFYSSKTLYTVPIIHYSFLLRFIVVSFTLNTPLKYHFSCCTLFHTRILFWIKTLFFFRGVFNIFFCNVSLNTHGLTSAYASNYLLMITFKILLLHFTYLGMYVIFLYLCWKVSLLYIVENNIFNQWSCLT